MLTKSKKIINFRRKSFKFVYYDEHKLFFNFKLKKLLFFFRFANIKF